MTVQQAFDLALQHHQAGRMAEAEALYRQILAVQPNHGAALHFLGVIAYQMGRYELASELIRQAIVVHPSNSAAYSNLGLALAEQGQFDEAVAAHRRALQLKPNDAATHYNLGNALKGKGRLDEAIVEFRRAIDLNPHFTKAYDSLGDAFMDNGRIDEAVAVCRRTLQLQPDNGGAYNNLGNALAEQGYLEEAVAAYRQAIQLTPGDAVAYYYLGNALKKQDQFDEAIDAFRRALQLKPNFAEAYCNLGNTLTRQGRLDEAVAAYQRALELKPDDPGIHANLGTALAEQGRLDEAIATYQRALKFKPGQPLVHSNLVYALHFHPSQDDKTISEEHGYWHRQFSEPLKQLIVPHANDRNPKRPLRIGYISPDFREHVVGRNLIPLFRCHDHWNFEILGYSGVVNPDSVTEEFRRHADQWHGTVGVSDEALAGMIRRDEVDILVDLTQHMAGNRLTMFAQKPAPVQVSFAGYPESTGVEAIEYRISDRWLEAELESFPYAPRKECVFLIDSFWCYDPCGMEVEINELPVKASGLVTFGCLNNFCKVNEPLLRFWARILRELPEARLVILSGLGSHRQRTVELLEREGIETRRVEFVGRRSRREYLELYHRLDVVLDTFPYNGHTTGLDALWMGVPVVSLAGERPVSRAGLSQLSNLGLPELVAHSEEEYVEIATRLALDLPRLAELRRTLRPRMEASVLMDAPRFTRNIEAAYRAMWRRWCGESGT